MCTLLYVDSHIVNIFNIVMELWEAEILAGCVIIASINHQLAPSPLSFLRLNSASCTTGQKAIFQTASFDKFIWELSHLTHFLANLSKAGKYDMTVVRLKRRLWNGWTTACCWICLDCAYISIQPTRERRSNCQTSTGKSHQTRAPLPTSDILRMEEELLDFYGIGVVWFKVEGETLQDQARCDDFCIGGVKRTATVTWSCLTAKSQICKNVQTIVTKVTDSGVLIFYASRLQPNSFLHESAGGNYLNTHYIPYQENANNLKNPRISDEDGVCSAVGLRQLGSRAGPGGAFHGHGAFFSY